jgi:uncharacterized protein
MDKDGLLRALAKIRMESGEPTKNYKYPIQPPQLMPGIVPAGQKAAVAMDSGPFAGTYEYVRLLQGFSADFNGFPGYPYLAALSTRAEYRNFAQSMGTQLTREWIVLNSTETAGAETKKKCTELTQMITDLGLKQCIELMAEQESFYGRAQMALSIGGQDPSLPLILSPKTIPVMKLKDGMSFEKAFRISAVEALWTTPKGYNAIDATAPDFYKPNSWFVIGQEWHSTRLISVCTRPVSDMLKPAFNFGGISMSQLAEPYVDNWLRTRQAVADLINNFSIVNLATSMDQVLQGSDDGQSLFNRAELFTLTRSNRGLMLTDKEREELQMLASPLGGLDALQAQAQEQMCSVSHIPAVILLGVAPTGFGNVSEGEIRAFYDWIAALQETWWRKPIEIVVNILQLIRYGQIDPDIIVTFQPLYQMTPKELAEIRTADAATDGVYIDRGVLDAEDVREKLARNPESGYQGIDVNKLIGQTEQMEEGDLP